MQIDVRLDEVVLHALEKEPGRRYQHASEVKTAVEFITTGAALQPPHQPRKGPMTTTPSKAFAYGLATAAACLAIGLAIWFFVSRGGGDASRLTQEGWQLWQARQLEQAAAKFNQATKLDPKKAEAWNGLGWASFNSGMWAEAEKAFQSAVALDSNHAAALNGLGQLYLAQKKKDLAETYLLKAAPRAPAAWYGLARLYLLEGKFDRAEEWAAKVVDSGQADDTARQMLQAAKAKQLPEGLRLVLEPQ
jgi:tetratricopeptide (TPR) repeat protein